MVKEATELALASIKATLQQLESEVEESVRAKTCMGLRLAEIEGQLGIVTNRVGDVLSLRLTDIEKAQEWLMHVVEGINA